MPARSRQRVGGVKRETGRGGYQIAKFKNIDFVCIFPIFFFIYRRLIGCFRYNLKRGERVLDGVNDIFYSKGFALGLILLRTHVKSLASGHYKITPFSREGRYVNHIN